MLGMNFEPGIDCAKLPLAVPFNPNRPRFEEGWNHYKELMRTLQPLNVSDKTWTNRVFRRAFYLARRGKWQSCGIVLNRHIYNHGLELTKHQRWSIRDAMRHGSRISTEDNQVELAYEDYKI